MKIKEIDEMDWKKQIEKLEDELQKLTEKENRIAERKKEVGEKLRKVREQKENDLLFIKFISRKVFRVSLVKGL